MNSFDRQIRDALAADQTELYSRFSEPALLEQVIETFRGRSRWLVALAFVVSVVWLGFACVSAYQFFHAEDTRSMIAWAGGFGFSLLAIALVKIWYWMELNKNAVTREVKRLELLLTQLVGPAKTPTK